MNYQTFNIGPNFIIEARAPRGFELSDFHKTEIESIWRHEQSGRTSQLYNGEIFNLIEVNNQHLIGEFVDYRLYLAQLRNPSFVELLDIKPLCVSGLTIAGNKVLVGQRSENVTTHKTFFETVPSGGVDSTSLSGNQINIKRQFENELWEETGISVTEIKNIELFSLIYDIAMNLYEICAEVQVNYTVLKQKLEPTDEYINFKWLTKEEIKQNLQDETHRYVPLSIHLLKNRYLKKSVF